MNKKMRLDEEIPAKAMSIGTHNGCFHCDDALACFLLKQLPRFRDAEIIRSRDPAVLAKADARVDVGGVYDKDQWSFDHHQNSFTLTMAKLRPELKNADIKLSSAGLIFHHFGQEIIAAQMKREDPDDPDVLAIFQKVYENFIREIDAIDNGVNAADGELRYQIKTGLSSRVGNLNLRWYENQCPEETLRRFHKAMELAGSEFREQVDYFEKAWLPARALVREAVEERLKVHDSGEIVLLSKGGCPWTDHLFEIEDELKMKGHVKYMIFEDVSGSYRVRAVPLSRDSFESRLPLPWKGLRDEELSKECGIPDCVFVHNSGFIGGHKTKEGAIQMAVKALSMKA